MCAPGHRGRVQDVVRRRLAGRPELVRQHDAVPGQQLTPAGLTGPGLLRVRQRLAGHLPERHLGMRLEQQARMPFPDRVGLEQLRPQRPGLAAQPGAGELAAEPVGGGEVGLLPDRARRHPEDAAAPRPELVGGQGVGGPPAIGQHAERDVDADDRGAGTARDDLVQGGREHRPAEAAVAQFDADPAEGVRIDSDHMKAHRVRQSISGESPARASKMVMTADYA